MYSTFNISDSLDLSGRGTTRTEDAQGTPTQSHISPSKLVYEEKEFVHRQLLNSWIILAIVKPTCRKIRARPDRDGFPRDFNLTESESGPP